jgi:hypothetical protein
MTFEEILDAVIAMLQRRLWLSRGDVRSGSNSRPSGQQIVASAAQREAVETAGKWTYAALTAEIRPIADVACDGPDGQV